MERSMHVKFPVFSNYDIEIVLATDQYKARSKYDKTYGVFDSPFHSLHSHNRAGKALLVFCQKNLNVSTMAHESFHAVSAMMEWAGVKFDNECMAYHIGYLTQKVYDFARSK